MTYYWRITRPPGSTRRFQRKHLVVSHHSSQPEPRRLMMMMKSLPCPIKPTGLQSNQRQIYVSQFGQLRCSFFFVRTPQTNPVSCKPVPLREQHSFHTSLIIHQSLQTAFLASSLYRGSTCSAPEALHYSGATEAIDGSVIFATFRAFSLHLMSFFDGCG